MGIVICNRLEYCFVHEVLTVLPDGVRLRSGCSLRKQEASKIEYTKSDKPGDAGTIITEIVKIKTGVDTKSLTDIKDGRIILQLYTLDGIITVGSLMYPVTYSYQQKPPETEITFTTKH